MLPTDYNDFLTECADSALGSIKYHEAQMKYADEQIAYWQQRRQHEQNAWNNAYVDYHTNTHIKGTYLMTAKQADKLIGKTVILFNTHFQETFEVTIIKRDRWLLYGNKGERYERQDCELVEIVA